MGRGRRYDNEKKLNVKKVIAVMIALVVLVMFVIIINKLLQTKAADGTVKTAELSYFPVYTNDKWGVIDGNGKTVIPATYEEMIVIPNNNKAVFICYENVKEDGTYDTKVINEKGEEIFTQYDKVAAIENFDEQHNLWYEENVLKVEKDGKQGLIDLTGKTVLAYEYEQIEALKGTQNSILTIKEEKYGLVDNKGTTIIANEYKEIIAISDKYEDGYIVKSQEDKYGIIGYNKQTILEPKYEEIKKIHGNDMYVAKEEGTWKVVSKEETVLESKWDDIEAIDGENIIVKKGKKYGVVNKAGEEKIPVEYDSLTFAFLDYYIAEKEEKFGMINLQNEEVVEFTYNNLHYRKDTDFIEASKDNITSEFLDRDLKVRVTGILSEVNKDKGYMRIRVGEEYQYYNFKFEEKKSTEVLTTNTLFLSKKDGKYGYVNKDGIVVVNYIYDDATEQNAYGFASVKKDGVWGSISAKGEVVVEPKYNLDNNYKIDFISKYYLGPDLNAYYYTDK